MAHAVRVDAESVTEDHADEDADAQEDEKEVEEEARRSYHAFTQAARNGEDAEGKEEEDAKFREGVLSSYQRRSA